MPISVYTKPTLCRLKRAYANAYATYAVCMGAYAWGIICLVEFPPYLFFWMQKKNYSMGIIGSPREARHTEKKILLILYIYI